MQHVACGVGVRNVIATFAFASLMCAISSCAKPASEAPAPNAAAGAQPQAVAQASHDVPPPAAVAGAVETVQGRVLESFDSSGYTYVRVKTDQGEVWAATLAFKVAVGDTVVVPLENPMRNFRSQALKRDFDLVYFATRIGKPGEAAPSASSGALPPGHPPTNPAATPESPMPAEPNAKLIDKIAPPQGGMAVANVWANRKSLAGKLITVRGKVMKYNPGIMGLNWIHLQDGSGVVKDGTHDLTVTTTNETRVGDVVTITGTVVVDKSFGAGYGYAVMLQGARVAR